MALHTQNMVVMELCDGGSLLSVLQADAGTGNSRKYGWCASSLFFSERARNSISSHTLQPISLVSPTCVGVNILLLVAFSPFVHLHSMSLPYKYNAL